MATAAGAFEALRDATAMIGEVNRVLRPGGRYLQITFAQPHFRRR